MVSSFRRYPPCIRAVTLTLILVLMTCSASAREKLRTIVIDPGHGGGDPGITGSSQLLEKNLTLAVAERIVKERKGKYRVVLTRTGDYALNLFERTALANNQKADLFISIHAGGSLSQQQTGCTLYYFKPSSPAEPDTSVRLPDPQSFSAVPTAWDNCQVVHAAKSKTACDTIAAYLSEPFSSTGSSLKTTIKGYPLTVLSGADMPALLMEIGYITSPGEAKNLLSDIYITEITEKICRGVDSFFLKNNTADE